MKLNPYLSFNGNCKEAFEFYVMNLGAKMLMCMTYADAPKGAISPDCGPAVSDKVMHARLEMLDGSVLMGSDAPEGRYAAPAGFHLNLGLTEVKDAERVFRVLSEKGQVFMPLEETFWATRFAMFADRFGTPWMINIEKERP